LTFAALSDGTKIDNPKYYRKSERKLARLQRRLSRKKKGSNNRGKGKVIMLHDKMPARYTDKPCRETTPVRKERAGGQARTVPACPCPCPFSC